MKQGQNKGSQHLRIFWLDNNLEANRYGVAATTAVGGAVRRNLVRRWSRELLRRWDPEIVQGQDIVVMANRKGADESYGAYVQELASLLVRANLGQRAALLAGSGVPNVQ
jgi:ribonuclease P protein component